ncbi:hypothetical protein [Rhizobium mongolense]|uniref:Uncharacterized protein n=2 Tax=Rhizobium mongolense TaxID=57676 RepID=A0ABR6IYB1_9HYPH|nr:hypothetical protein [Rhizobium mongolense]MBB4232518.1 hypothetical protein [Rhizobium mongolense]TVZ75040.1 hypothetical protein BCL32_0413 [Rhizobium mongolense USDA 1844]
MSRDHHATHTIIQCVRQLSEGVASRIDKATRDRVADPAWALTSGPWRLRGLHEGEVIHGDVHLREANGVIEGFHRFGKINRRVFGAGAAGMVAIILCDVPQFSHKHNLVVGHAILGRIVDDRGFEPDMSYSPFGWQGERLVV